MDDVFNIENFNIIQDNDNYYFFRALNMADNADIDGNITTDENGNITRINNCLENIAKDIPHERDLLDNTYFQLENAKQESQKEFPKEQELQEKLRKLEEINAELKINENEHEMLGDEKEEKQDKSPDKNSPERL